MQLLYALPLFGKEFLISFLNATLVAFFLPEIQIFADNFRSSCAGRTICFFIASGLDMAMKKIILISVVTLPLFLTGCATQSNWAPTIDPYKDPHADRINLDLQQCKQLAEQASGSTVKETAKGAGVGALIGAAGGAVLGAAVGSPGTGAAIGASAGAVGGGAKLGLDAELQFKRAYVNCLRQRGHKVIN